MKKRQRINHSLEEKKFKKKTSNFMIWLFGTLLFTLIYIGFYFLASHLGWVSKLQDSLTKDKSNIYDAIFKILFKKNQVNEDSALSPEYASAITFSILAAVAISYLFISLRTLLSHRAAEDSRNHCIPILLTPIFLIIENGVLHIFQVAGDADFYTVTMTVFSSMAVGVITFASLKFSFGLSTQQKRLNETSSIKPDISISQPTKNTYSATILKNGCYFCGAYIGKICKIFYWDIKKTGNSFKMVKLFFPNRKVFFENGNIAHQIDFSECDNNINNEYQHFLDLYMHREEFDQCFDFYWIFRDAQNYYYFVQMPTNNVPYNVIGVNEHMMTRLLFYHNKRIYKQKKPRCKLRLAMRKLFRFVFRRKDKNNKKRYIKYKAMDWFKIPYNFYPENASINNENQNNI